MSEVAEAAGVIRAVPADAARRLACGPVILSLAGACKELIENAIDAGATSIDIRFKNLGVDAIEVSDDGSGILSDDFPNLCKPHRTSKIAEFDDLGDVLTFGFRGEALHALAATSEVSIWTKHKDDSLARKLQFDHGGEISFDDCCVRQTGTTVLVENLFATLPVRRAELAKNVRREHSKALAVVQAFAVVSVGVRFVCSTVSCDKRQQVFATSGGRALRDNICGVFGAAQLASLLPIEQCAPDDAVLTEYGVVADTPPVDISITGFVSTCEHGKGRSAADRQFVFVNGRPVDYDRVSRVANEVYHQFNRAQYPMLVLCTNLPHSCVDVNVTPDKRRVLCGVERLLLATLKHSLLRMFGQLAARCPGVAFGPAATSASNTPGTSSRKAAQSSRVGNGPTAAPPKQQRTLTEFVVRNEAPTRVPQLARCSERGAEGGGENGGERLADVVARATWSNLFRLPPGVDDVVLDECPSPPPPPAPKRHRRSSASKASTEPSCEGDCPISARRSDSANGEDVVAPGNERAPSLQCAPIADVIAARPSRIVQFSLDDLPAESTASDDGADDDETKKQGGCRFSTELTEPDAKAVEAELARTLTSVVETTREWQGARCSKDAFERMVVVGQFNRGFIICRLDDDLFIIDQHASDEKYMFEKFQRTATVQTQQLIQSAARNARADATGLYRPRALDLSAVAEAVLLDNLAIFRKNGFHFRVDDDAGQGKRALLVAVPILHNYTFDRSDIDDMIEVLREMPGVLYRPPNLRRVFASRACRKSVMIGSALDEQKMTSIVRHLSTLDNPWSCPHGRPTLRHLTSMRQTRPTDPLYLE